MNSTPRRALALGLALALGACDDADPEPTLPPADARAAAEQGPLPDRGPDATADAGPDARPVDAGRDATPDAGCQCPGQQRCEAGACVEPETCATAVDCLGERRCAAGVCTDPCAEDLDCPGGRCDLATLLCTDTRRCQRDVDCADEALICLEGECAPRCGQDTCPGRQRCDPGRGRCVEGEGCADDADCLDGRICAGETCLNPCLEAADCAGAQTCEGGRCVEASPCAADADCLAARICSAGACADPCPLAGCPGALECELESGRCGEASPCADDAGCFPGRRCDAGACVAPCAEAADCAGAQTCAEGRCAEPARCTGPLDCLGERICGPDGTCADRCAMAGCPGSLRCEVATGACLEAAPCADDTGCFAGRACQDGACIAPCRENADCPGAMRCAEGRCQEPARCTTDLDCLGERRCQDRQCQDPCVAGQCPGARVCQAGLCQEGPRCAAAVDCDPGRACAPGLGVCVAPCPDGQCPEGQICGADGLCGEPAACADDTVCLGERRCLLGRCGAAECAAHAACPGARCVGFTCAAADPLPCPAGWAAVDGHCEQPGPCTPGDGRCPAACGPDGLCAACAADADCPGAQRCQAGACLNPLDCAADGDCLPGYTCLLGSCTPAPCAEDRLAGNHSPVDAVALPAIDLRELVACEARADYFAVGDPAGLKLVARFDAAGPPLRLALLDPLDPFGDPVDISVPAPGEAWVAAPPGDWLLRVEAPPGGGRPYRLELTAGVACVNDPYDRPWRNDDAARARLVPAGALRGVLCPGDEDFFRYAGPGRVRVAVAGAQGTANGQPTPAEVDAPALIRVTGAGAYDLQLTPLDAAAARCAAAQAVPLGVPVDASVAAGPDDFALFCRPGPGPDRVLRLDIPAAGELTAELLDADPTAGLALYRDCGAAPLACGVGAQRLQIAVQPGPYALVVDGPYAGRVQASLAAAPAGEACAAPAPLAFDTPTPVPVGTPAQDLGGACLDPFAGDLGAFSFELAAPATVALSIEGAGPMSALSLRGACADPATETGCAPGPDPRLEIALPAGRHVVLAQGGGQLRLQRLP